MSADRKYYTIVGYDLTGFETDKYHDWEYTDEWEEYTCNHIKGNIQLFYDPMCRDHLYLGYILAAGYQYEFETTKFTIKDIEEQMIHVTDKLFELVDIGIISKDPKLKLRPNVIVFEECT